MKKFFLLAVSLLLILPLVSSATSFYVPRDTNYSVRFTCEIDDAICTDSASCNVSVYSLVNSSFIGKNMESSNLGSGGFEYNLTQNQTAIKGEYKIDVSCWDGNVNGTNSFIYEVNPSGIRSTEQRTDTMTRTIYIFIGLGVLFFIAFLVTPKLPIKLTFFIFFLLCILVGLNLSFLAIQEEVINPTLESFFDSFTGIIWILYWFIGAFLIIVWIFTFIQTWLFKKNMKRIERFGDG